MGAAAGFSHFLGGLGEWRRRPGLMLLGIVPAILVLLLLTAAFVTLLFFVDDLVAWATPFADDWGDTVRRGLRLLLGLVVLAGAAFLSVMTFTGLTLTVGDPIYEKVWRETERDLGGPVPEDGLSWMESARDSLVLVVLGVATAVCVFVIGLVPVVGTLAGPVLGVLFAGRLLARELVSRPLAARGLDRDAQNQLLRPHQGALLGFGAGVQLCFLVPGGAVLMMPAAVAGATRLAREVLEAQANASVT